MVICWAWETRRWRINSKTLEQINRRKIQTEGLPWWWPAGSWSPAAAGPKQPAGHLEEKHSKQEGGMEIMFDEGFFSHISLHTWYEPGVTGATAATGGDITPPTGRTLTAVDTRTHTRQISDFQCVCFITQWFTEILMFLSVWESVAMFKWLHILYSALYLLPAILFECKMYAM